MKTLKIVSRKSPLARIQALLVAEKIAQSSPDIQIQHTFKSTLGDADLTTPLNKMPDIGVFTNDIRDDLLSGEADIAVHSWYGTLVLNNAYNASEFLEVESYKHLGRWAKQITERPAYKRGSLVNRKPNGPDDKEILERHDASDIKL